MVPLRATINEIVSYASDEWRDTTVLSGGRAATAPPGCARHLPSTSSPSNNSAPRQQPPAARRVERADGPDGHALTIRTPGPIDTCGLHAGLTFF